MEVDYDEDDPTEQSQGVNILDIVMAGEESETLSEDDGVFEQAVLGSAVELVEPASSVVRPEPVMHGRSRSRSAGGGGDYDSTDRKRRRYTGGVDSQQGPRGERREREFSASRESSGPFRHESRGRSRSRERGHPPHSNGSGPYMRSDRNMVDRPPRGGPGVASSRGRYRVDDNSHRMGQRPPPHRDARGPRY